MYWALKWSLDGEIVRIGGKHLDAPGFDILGIMTGSEGLLGVVTEVTVRILRKPATQRAMLVGLIAPSKPDRR